MHNLYTPEYTGENRCVPCTVVNLGISVTISTLFALISPILSIGTLLFCTIVIYFRGYLVPGTPTLTKRYLPDRVLRYFDKHPASTTADNTLDEQIDPEAILLDSGAVAPCEDMNDLCLDPDFREAWHARMNALIEGGVGSANARRVLGIESESLSFDNPSNALIAVHDGDRIAYWESTEALAIDAAGSTELARQYDEWHELAPANRIDVLTGRRVFADECPACSGPVTPSEEVAESCCRSFDVVAMSCADCDARLLEVEIPTGS